ncbi:LPO_1073/Vpar_1526 family protein [Streptomyces yangpuensis]|uniref:LPO_1073/Vpar_1526 family protein n=1 Tax=Streptomyces yangpuensis TaxID=1648182 RepID=UPI0036515774
MGEVGSRMMRRTQKAGDGSTNYQAGTIQISGITYSEAREIALDVFRANALEFSQVARATAEERVIAITDAFFRELLEKCPDSLESIKDPAVQRAVFRVQEEYACSGDEKLGQVLVDMLVDRCQSSDRDLKQITLSEAMKTAPKLANNHFAILSCLLFVARTKFTGVGNVDLLHERFLHVVAPLATELRVSESDLRHLQYAGCLSVDLMQSSFGEKLSRAYPGLYTRGFDETEIKEPHRPYVMPCLRDKSKNQVAAVYDEDLDPLLAADGVLDGHKAELKAMMSFNLMPPREVEEEISALHPNIRNLVGLWNSTQMQSCQLTGVGIAIGHANARRLLKEGFSAGIEVWVN